MVSTRFVSLVVTAAVVLGAAAPAQGQIFAWRDSNGNLVLSDRKPASARSATYSVGSSTIRTTRRADARAAGRYDALIDEHALANGVDADLVRAVIQVESAYNPRARSPKGAMGLMQLMPGTAAEFGVLDAYNPAENIRGGVAYLRSLLDRYGDDPTLALAAYNAGPTAVEKYGNTVPPYRETRQYVDRVRNMTGPVAASGGRVIYKTMVLVNGQMHPKYSNQKPATGPYQVVVMGR